MKNFKPDEMDEYIISQEHRDIVGDGTFENYYKAYWFFVDKFDRDGVHYLERAHQTNPIKGNLKDAAFAVAKEWRDKRDAARQLRADLRSKLTLALAGPAALAAVFALYRTFN